MASQSVASAVSASTVTTITTAQVLAAEAAASAGAIGTYSLLTDINLLGPVALGTIKAGSGYAFGNANGTYTGTPAGTWRLMAYQGSGSFISNTSLWQRIA